LNKLKNKLAVDLAMTLLFLSLMFATQTGWTWHETAGLGAGLLVLIHLCLNSGWIRGVLKHQTTQRNECKTDATGRNDNGRSLKILMNSTIAITLLISLITGILISVVLFPDLGIGHRALFVFIHKWSSYLAGGLMLLHLLMHASYLKKSVHAVFSGKAGKRLKNRITITASLLMLGIFAWGQYRSIASSVQNTADEQSASASSSDNQEVQVITEQPAEVPEEVTVADSGTQITEPVVSLQEYLSGLTCTGCGKHCLLTSPRCGKGEVQASQATDEYNQTYTEA
jgi:hypothetical protein